MAEANIKLEKPCTEQDPAYHAVLSDFQKYCESTILNYQEHETKDSNEGLYNSFGQKYDLNSDIPATETLSKELTLLCSELALWIYTPHDTPIPKPFQFKDNKDNDFFHWHYKKIIQAKQTQISQWAFLQFSGQPKNAYLVFKGTDPDKIFDVLADSSFIPMPIWCKQDAKNPNNNNTNNEEWQFCVHSGMYATLMRDFYRIWNIINARMTMFDNLYVIGHSLGGGLAILFGLQSIINKCIPSNKSMHVITFGSPCVISYEKQFNLLSLTAKKILYSLHNKCHCFINRFDPIPRIPTRIEWMITVIPYALRKIVALQVKQKMKLPNFLIPFIKSGVKSGVSKFVRYVEKYLDLLRSYHPFGTYYFYAGKDCDQPFTTRNQTVIKDLLGFIPPHKIVTSDGQELRVSHYSTKLNEINGIKHQSRFSLSHVTELTSNEKNSTENKEHENGIKNNEEKVNIIDLLMQKTKTINDTENIIYDNSALYVSVESDNDKVRDEYRAKKLSEHGWVMLVSNHLMEQYINIFKVNLQDKKSKYPMLPPKDIMDNKHFSVKENDDDNELASTMYATANLVKTTGKKIWNQAKEKYQKEMDEYQKRKEKETEKKQSDVQYGPGYQGLNNNNMNNNVAPVIHQQAIQYQQYSQYQQYPQYQYYQPQYIPSPSHGHTQQMQPQSVYVQQPINLSNNQQIGNTQYRIAQHSTHYVVYQQPNQPIQHLPQQPQQHQQPQQSQQSQQQSLYPSLSKK